MTHIDEKTMLDILTGKLPLDEGDKCREHMHQCPACKEKFEDFRLTWDWLGDLDDSVGPVDLSAEIMVHIRKDRQSEVRFTPGVLMKTAASIALAVFLGYLAGREFKPQQSHPEITLAQAFYLQALQPHSSTGWSDPMQIKD